MKKILFVIAAIAPVLGLSQNTFPSSGNVGIGTTSPTGKLVVSSLSSSGADHVAILKQGNSYNLDIYSSYYGNDDLNAGSFGYGVRPSDDAWQIWNRDGLGDTWRNLFHVTKTGSIGVGTTSPSGKIDIAAPDETVASALSIRQSNDHRFGFDLGLDQSLNGNMFLYRVFDNSRISIMEFDRANGNIGIGSTNLDSKLSVNGTIHTKEVKVDLNNWPDYVFNKEYSLQPLSEVKQYINQNGHLPEMPSAKEVETDGLHLGQMNALLLKKIEELTLHVIRQQEEIEHLKEALKK